MFDDSEWLGSTWTSDGGHRPRADPLRVPGLQPRAGVLHQVGRVVRRQAEVLVQHVHAHEVDERRRDLPARDPAGPLRRRASVPIRARDRADRILPAEQHRARQGRLPLRPRRTSRTTACSGRQLPDADQQHRRPEVLAHVGRQWLHASRERRPLPPASIRPKHSLRAGLLARRHACSESLTWSTYFKKWMLVGGWQGQAAAPFRAGLLLLHLRRPRELEPGQAGDECGCRGLFNAGPIRSRSAIPRCSTATASRATSTRPASARPSTSRASTSSARLLHEPRPRPDPDPARVHEPAAGGTDTQALAASPGTRSRRSRSPSTRPQSSDDGRGSPPTSGTWTVTGATSSTPARTPDDQDSTRGRRRSRSRCECATTTARRPTRPWSSTSRARRSPSRRRRAAPRRRVPAAAPVEEAAGPRPAAPARRAAAPGGALPRAAPPPGLDGCAGRAAGQASKMGGSDASVSSASRCRAPTAAWCCASTPPAGRFTVRGPAAPGRSGRRGPTHRRRAPSGPPVSVQGRQGTAPQQGSPEGEGGARVHARRRQASAVDPRALAAAHTRPLTPRAPRLDFA